MTLLMLFALVAGAGTALSPCVLPVLPAVLSAGATGGHRRPFGVVTGLVISFTFATVALVYVIEAMGLPDDLVRTLAIATLAVFGLILILPRIAARVEAWAQRLAPGPASVSDQGFTSGVILGLSLGFVYAPCAGPVLAGVITVSAAQDFTAGKLAVAFSYALGSALVLYVLMLGGRRLTRRLSPFLGRIQIALGAVMIAVAVAIAVDLDLKFQNAIADDLPGFLVNPTGGIEESGAIADELADVSGGHGASEVGADEANSGQRLPIYGRAPDFVDTQRWFNTPGGRPLSINKLTRQGHVVLIDFWTYTCINCIRTLPQIRAWASEYRDDGLVVVGVHTPEFAFEKEASNVESAIDEFEIGYPVVQDNEYGTWTAYGNRYWPSKYLIDANGNVRFVHFGEGEYETTEAAIRSLLAEAGRERLGSGVRSVRAEVADPRLGTPETYLGSARAEGWVTEPVVDGVRDFGTPEPSRLRINQFAYGGRWRIDPESGTAISDSSISLRFQGRRVFLVMGAGREPHTVQVLLDGEPIPDGLAGKDVAAGAVSVSRQRLYRLVDLQRAGRHTLTLRFEPGISGFAFTFG